MPKKGSRPGLVLLTIVALFLGGCLLDGLAPGSVIEIYGSLDDELSNEPVAGAQVSAGGKTTYSDEEGLFHLAVPYSFDLEITIYASGYEVIEIPVFMPPRDGAVEIRRSLSPTFFETVINGTVEIDYHPPTHYYTEAQKLFPGQAPKLNQESLLSSMANTDEVLIRFRSTVASQAIKNTVDSLNLLCQGRIEGTDIFIYSQNNPMDIQETLRQLARDESVEIAEPNYSFTAQSYFYNDPYYAHQWNLQAIHMEDAWRMNKGSKDVTVAVLDTGLLMEHPDLQENILAGYDFIDDDDVPLDTNTDFSHGTHVAGIIGAVADNRLGIAGVSPRVSLLPVRVMDAQGRGSYATLIKGLYFATANGADIINMSLGGPAPSELLHEALIHAHNRGVTLIAAAGNDGGSVIYPAAYPEVIAVGAVDLNFERTAYSNYGPEIDLVAPGGDASSNNGLIVSTTGRYNAALRREIHTYQGAQGTSMAAPHVSGVAALLVSQGINNPNLIKDILINTSTPAYGNNFSNQYGWGLLNAAAALRGERDRPLIFAARQHDEDLIVIGQASKADTEGEYLLTDIPPGTYRVYGWLDNDGDGMVSAGDLFGSTLKEIDTRGENLLTGIDFDLEMYVNPQNISVHR